LRANHKQANLSDIQAIRSGDFHCT